MAPRRTSKSILLQTKFIPSNKEPRSKTKVRIEKNKMPTAYNSQIDKLRPKFKHEYDKGGVKRLYSTFNRFANNNPSKPSDNRKGINSTYRSQSPNGLSPKEKSYVICSCQARSSRYTYLKELAKLAIKQNKIFSVYGNCTAVRKALNARGWVEKVPSHRMNLSKIRNGTLNKVQINSELERLLLSNLVEKQHPTFIWYSRENSRYSKIESCNEQKSIINKLKVDAMWTTKQGLCRAMKRNYWFYIEDVAEASGPRTYDSNTTGEVEDFVRDYRVTACTSLLKWLLSMISNDRPVFTQEGIISTNVIVFALNRCKEYIFRKQNKDIDNNMNTTSPRQWNSFLKKYYKIIGKTEVFHLNVNALNKIAVYLQYSKFLLKEMHKYRPQLSCEGCHNIWIIKPSHCSRGRGIRMASTLGVITNLLNKSHDKYVIQKYIEEPLLIHDTKFDIRQYYLVTSTYPLVIWMYTDCYLKFSTQKYNLKNYHESIHLTNNAVQRRYKNCKDRNPELPESNMWDLETYRSYLISIGKDNVWDNIIYPGMKKTIIGIMLSCQDALTAVKNRFEIYGCDFILDKEYKPWIIEINSCPDLQPTTVVTAKICPAVVADIIKVVIDHKLDSKCSTGKFECMYHQSITVPKFGGALDLSVRGFSLPLDYFYRGNIALTQSCDDNDIEIECDVESVLNKLTQLYNHEDIMVEPDEFEIIKNYNRDDDLRESACDILHANKKLGSENNAEEYDTSSKSSYSSNEEFLLDVTLKEPTKSVTAILSISSNVSDKSSLSEPELLAFRGYYSYFTRKSHTIISQSNSAAVQSLFTFSKLDDGPMGKASLSQFKNKEIIRCRTEEVFKEFNANENTSPG